MITLKHIRNGRYEYESLVGTGGIGSGIFFALEGNETMGRNESRMATLLPYKDYCKQHIILHYIAVLLGAGNDDVFNVFPIGRVSNDVEGTSLLAKMKEAGMNTASVGISKRSSTMFSVCYQYPDKSGGNITTANSACNEITPDDIHAHFGKNSALQNNTIILAAPEVSVLSRITLLQHGRKYGSLNAACVSSAEVEEFKSNGGLLLTDILALNIDEAMNFANISDEAMDKQLIASACIRAIKKENPSIKILITCGATGVFSCNENYDIEFTPALKVDVVSTAGAGDAFLAGVICGINCGLPLSKNTQDSFFGQSPLSTAIELGTLVASMSVTAADTIHGGINASSLFDFIHQKNIAIGDEFSNLFQLKNTVHGTHTRP